MALLEVQNLSLEFGGKTVLRDLGFTLDRGEVKVVMGPSGSGKSSLLRCLNLLQKPTSGKILLNGQDITAPGTDVCAARSASCSSSSACSSTSTLCTTSPWRPSSC